MPELEQEMEIGDGMQPKSLVMSPAEDMSSDYQDVDETQEIGTKYIRNLDQNKSFPIYANQRGQGWSSKIGTGMYPGLQTNHTYLKVMLNTTHFLVLVSVQIHS